MPTNLPTGLDTYITKVDGVTTIRAADVNDLQLAMVQVENMVVGPFHFNVKAYGAKGDAATDDTAAINAAITAAAAAGVASVVFFPPGTYLFSGFTLPVNVSIRGASRSASVLRYTGSGIAINAATDWSFLTLSDFTLNATSSVANYGISNHFVTRDTTIERFGIQNFKGGLDLWQTINVQIGLCRITGQGGSIAGGIGIKLGDGANISTTTTLLNTYITDYETAIRNEACVGLVLILPIIEFYKNGIFSLNKTTALWPYFEAGIAGKVSIHSEDTFVTIGGTIETAPVFAGVGQARYISVGTDLVGQLNVDSLSFSSAASRIIPGATSLSHRNNANSADNLLITDAGDVTVRARLLMATAASKLIPGATNFSHRNNADSADNVLITDAGAVTIRGALTVGANPLIVNDAAASTSVQWQLAGVLKAMVGVAASAGAITPNTAVGDYVFRTQTQSIWFTLDGGTTSPIQIDTAAKIIMLNNPAMDFHYAATAAGTGAAPTLPANTPTGATGGAIKYVKVQLNGATAYLLASV